MFWALFNNKILILSLEIWDLYFCRITCKKFFNLNQLFSQKIQTFLNKHWTSSSVMLKLQAGFSLDLLLFWQTGAIKWSWIICQQLLIVMQPLTNRRPAPDLWHWKYFDSFPAFICFVLVCSAECPGPENASSLSRVQNNEFEVWFLSFHDISCKSDREHRWRLVSMKG